MNYRFEVILNRVDVKLYPVDIFLINGAMFIACNADVFAPIDTSFIVGILILEKEHHSSLPRITLFVTYY
jgi:hypothetical protein